MAFTIYFILILFMAVLEAAIPYLVKRTIVFGVTIPEKNLNDTKLNSYKKRFSIIVLSLTTIALILFSIWYFLSKPTEEVMVLFGTIIVFGILTLNIVLYFYHHVKVLQRKREEKWGEDLKQLKTVDLAVREQDEMLPWYLFLFPIVITVGVLVYTISQYQLLPDQIPTHWGINGQPDAFTDKNMLSVIQMPATLLFLQIMFMAINISTKRSGIKLSATNTAASRTRQLTLRKYSSWLMFMVSVLITMLFSFFQLSTIHEGLVGEAITFALPLTIMFIILIGSIIFAIRVGTAGNKLVTQPEEGIRDFDEDQYWKGGIFYFNKNDPSIFVEKRFGIGWTLNFANPKGYFIIIGPLIIILLLSFFG